MMQDHDHPKRARPLASVVLGLELSKSVFGALGKMLSGRREADAHAGEAMEKDERAADRNEREERGQEMHVEWGTLFVGCAFAIAVIGGAGFFYFYWFNPNTSWLGGSLAVFLAGLGAGLVLHAHWLMAHKQAIEPREPLPSSGPERESTLQAFREGEHDVRRRGLLIWMGAVGLGMIATFVVSLMRSLGPPPEPSLSDRVWKRGQRLMTLDGKAVSMDSLQPGNSVPVFPEDSIGDERAQTVLIRVQQELLQLPGDRDHWAPSGYVAYSRVCTHAGCPVGMFESTTNLLLCPCHQSTFNVLRAACPTSGPAARALPQLPLYADSDGTLRAGGGFSEPPGPGFWGMP
jgi:ubiquinol-cytochrome c reductase iron-sulfur subunit